MKINPIKQKVYKVVKRLRTGEIASASWHNLSLWGVGVKYTPNKIISPEFGRIFAFESISDARIFLGAARDYEVWEAEAYGVTKGDYRVTLSPYNYIAGPEKPISLYQKFWANHFNESLPNLFPLGARINAPSGTLYCKSIKLKKRIASVTDKGRWRDDGETK